MVLFMRDDGNEKSHHPFPYVFLFFRRKLVEVRLGNIGFESSLRYICPPRQLSHRGNLAFVHSGPFWNGNRSLVRLTTQVQRLGYLFFKTSPLKVSPREEGFFLASRSISKH